MFVGIWFWNKNGSQFLYRNWLPASYQVSGNLTNTDLPLLNVSC